MTETDIESRAAEAQRILSEPLVQEALKAIKDEIVNQWAACPARDTEGREWLWHHMQAATKFEGILRGAIANRAVLIQREKQGMLDKALRIIKA